MDLGELIPIVAIASSAMVALAFIRVWRERLAREAAPANVGENARLAEENEALRRTVRRLEERMAVLERIATDPAERTLREIEELR